MARKPKDHEIKIDKDELPLAYIALWTSLHAALTYIAERSETEDWYREVHDFIVKDLDGLNASLIHFPHPENSPILPKDIAGAMRDGHAIVDSLFDAVLAETRKRRGIDDDPAV